MKCKKLILYETYPGSTSCWVVTGKFLGSKEVIGQCWLLAYVIGNTMAQEVMPPTTTDHKVLGIRCWAVIGPLLYAKDLDDRKVTGERRGAKIGEPRLF